MAASSPTPSQRMWDSHMDQTQRYIVIKVFHKSTLFCQDLKCSIGHDAQMYTTCEDDSRITLIRLNKSLLQTLAFKLLYSRENSMCGIRISNPIPSDSGIWKVYTSGLPSIRYNINYRL